MDADTTRYFDELEEVFATRGWKHLVAEAKAQYDDFARQAMEAPDWGVVCELRGQAMQLARLVNLEEITAIMKQQALENAAEDERDEDADL